jgi:hypothetical protein
VIVPIPDSATTTATVLSSNTTPYAADGATFHWVVDLDSTNPYSTTVTSAPHQRMCGVDLSSIAITYELTLVGEPEGVVAGEFYAEADIDWTENPIGFDEGTLADLRFEYEATISSSTTETFDEDFYCSGDASLYEDGVYSYTEENIATLNPAFDS